MKNGTPFDVAFQMDARLRAAMSIIFSELEGAEFDFDTMAFRERK